MWGALPHAEDRGVDEGCGLRLGCRLGRRLTGKLARVLYSGLAGILLDGRSRRLLRMACRILGVRRRDRARRSGLGSDRRGSVDFDVGDGVAFDIVRVQTVAAAREVD
jgi:hypothetical protein